MVLVQVQGSDAFLERQERLVDFRSVKSRLLILVANVCSALASRQIDKRQFSVRFVSILDGDLEDGV